jgi:hypothetical protein
MRKRPARMRAPAAKRRTFPGTETKGLGLLNDKAG